MATSLSQEDINFLRLAGLLIRVAPRAVRQRFDFEFHPEQLQQFLRTNRGKIDNLTYKKRIITLAQYDVLYPRGSSGVSSDMFDVSLMVCLLRNFTDLDIQDSLPIGTIHTNAADISRIKFYRNSIVHHDSSKIDENEFSKVWNCVAEAIHRLLPDLKAEIDSLISSPLTNVNVMRDLIQLEKNLETTSQHMLTMNKKMATLETEKNNIKEIQLRTLKEWKDTDTKFIATSATTFILQSLKNSRGVIITGSPGCGKSAAAHHVAFELENEGYEILPCDDPSEIVKHLSTEKFQVFVIDDVCGKFSLNQQKADSWEQNDGKLNMLIESSNQNDDDEDNYSKPEAKFIITCRENIFVHKAFPKLTCFSLVQCSFSSDYKISQEEMRNIALSYLPENTVNDIKNICLYDFFPLICSLYYKNGNQDLNYFIHPVEIIGCEISKMKIKSEASFLCISLLVLRNNKFRKDELRCEDVKQLVNDICWDTKMESVSIVAILNSFERLKGIYITESDDIYTAIHDKMFDIISAAIAPSIMKCLIEHVDIAFLANRTYLSSFSQNSVPFVIHIPQEFESLYLKRQCQEALKGKYWEVFGSIQTEHEAYRKLLLSVLKEQDTCQQISYDSVEEGNTPLYVSSQLGYLDFVEYFVAKCANHIKVKDKEGRSPFYVACEKGHIAVVRYLMKHHANIDTQNVDDTTALSATCLNGHTEVAQLLLDNKADINITNKLISRVDSTIKNNTGWSAFHVACLNGHLEVVKLLFDAGVKNLNDTTNAGSTPLYQACLKGQFDIVKYLLDLNGKTLNSRVDTTIKEKDGFSVLHIACLNGHLEVVKLLIDVGINLNDTTNAGSTPLYLACLKGQFDIVKYLLDLNGKTLNSRVDTTIKDKYGWSALHIACLNGHLEIVKLLIDVGMNLNDRTTINSTPPHMACHNGHYEIVKYLLDLNDKTLNSRVDTTIKQKDGWSVLHVACFKGHLEVVKLLFDAGVKNLNDTTNAGSTPLYQACRKGRFDIVKYLLDLNGKALNSLVDTTIKEEDGWSVLHIACFKGHLEVVKLLFDAGVKNLNDTTNAGSTPLYQACRKGRFDIVKYLLDLNDKTLNSRVDTTIKEKDGFSILHKACLNGHLEVVKLLVDVGMNLNDTTNAGYTPLYLACLKGHYETVKYLLDLNDKTLNSRVDTTIKEKDGLSVLHIACFNAHLEVVKLLIDVGMNLNDTTTINFTPLYMACQNGHYETVKYLLDLNDKTLNSRVDTTIKQKDGWSVLHVACFKGHLEVVKLLFDAGVKNLNDTTNAGSTPLYQACRKGRFDIVKYLLDLNGKALNSLVDTTIKEEDGWSVLHIACFNGHLELVKLLIDVGMNLNDTTTINFTPLYMACQNGHYETVKFLLDLNGQTLNSRVDTTIKTKYGWSALHIACFKGHLEIVKLLIDVGMNLNDTTLRNSTPLYKACQGGHYETVKLLLDLNRQVLNSRVDTTIKNIFGESGLHLASTNGHIEVVKLLVDVGMNLNDTTNAGSTPLHKACRKGQFDIVKYLLDLNGKTLNSRVDTTIKEKDGLSVLHIACFNAHLEVVKLLIDVGMNLNDTTTINFTPLYMACQNGHYETVKYLLDLNDKTLNSRVDTTIKQKDGWSVLHIACSKGHLEVVKLLFDAGVKNLNDTTNAGSTPLYQACRKGRFDIVKYLLDLNGKALNSRVDTTIKEEDGWSVLHIACFKGHLEFVKLLIDVGMNLNDTTTIKFTPLYMACQNGHYETVKFLLDLNGQTLNSRVDTTIKTKYGWSALHIACFKGHLEIVKLLIDVGMNLNDTTLRNSTPLYQACQGGHYETVKLLLDLNRQVLNSRVDTTIKNIFGESGLHLASTNGHIEVVKLLVDVGMNLNDTTNAGSTPLHKACRKGQFDIVKYLLDLNGKTLNSRVDTTIKEKDGWSVLHIACFNGHLEVVKLLIDVGMNLNDTTKINSTPLHNACHEGRYETVKFLLDLNCQVLNSRVDTTIKETDGWSVLHRACFQGHLEIVKLLVDVGINLNDTTNAGYTPLYQACRKGRFDIVKYLLDLNGKTLNCRVDTLIKDTNGWSALHTACFNGHAGILQLLIGVGMDINERDNSGKTAVYLASINGHGDIVKILKDNCAELKTYDSDKRTSLMSAKDNGCLIL